MNSIKYILLGVAFLAVVASSCDQTTITPITPKGTEYSVYGPLWIGDAPNFIRVHDTNKLLNPQETKDLDVDMKFTNMETGESEFLKDRVKVYDDIYTHNFEIEDRIEFDTRYKFLWQDGDGFKDSLISQTTKESFVTVNVDTVDSCNQKFDVEFTNIDLEDGEELKHRIYIQRNGIWSYTRRKASSVYDAENEVLTLSWTPNSIPCLIDDPQCRFPNETTLGLACWEWTSYTIRLEYEHIGHMIGRETLDDVDLDSLGGSPFLQQVVLSTYSGEVDIILADDIFFPAPN